MSFFFLSLHSYSNFFPYDHDITIIVNSFEWLFWPFSGLIWMLVGKAKYVNSHGKECWENSVFLSVLFEFIVNLWILMVTLLLVWVCFVVRICNFFTIGWMFLFHWNGKWLTLYFIFRENERNRGWNGNCCYRVGCCCCLKLLVCFFWLEWWLLTLLTVRKGTLGT